jgi:hypothetical protein
VHRFGAGGRFFFLSCQERIEVRIGEEGADP